MDCNRVQYFLLCPFMSHQHSMFFLLVLNVFIDIWIYLNRLQSLFFIGEWIATEFKWVQYVFIMSIYVPSALNVFPIGSQCFHRWNMVKPTIWDGLGWVCTSPNPIPPGLSGLMERTPAAYALLRAGTRMGAFFRPDMFGFHRFSSVFVCFRIVKFWFGLIYFDMFYYVLLFFRYDDMLWYNIILYNII